VIVADTSPQAIAGEIASELGRAGGTGQRTLVAIAGAPASGKSTVAAALVAHLNDDGIASGLVPMDGFHLDNSILIERGLLNRKGAPETFDLAGFHAALTRLVHEDEVILPTFDRDLDKAIAGHQVIGKEHRVCVVEGNYLLFDEAGWRDLAGHWDLSIFVETDFGELQARLIQRWLDHGLNDADARARALSNDMPNAQRVIDHRLPSDLSFRSDA
jgi:fructokinase